MQRLHAANVTCGLKGVLNGSRCTLSISLRSPELSRLADLSRLTKKDPAVAKQIVSTGCRNMKAFSYCCLGISPHSQIQGSLDSSCLLSALVKGCCWGGGGGVEPTPCQLQMLPWESVCNIAYKNTHNLRAPLTGYMEECNLETGKMDASS